MRYRRMRFDVWLCLLLAYLVSMGTSAAADKILPKMYEKHKEEHKVAAGEVGGVADASLFRAQSVDDLLSHDLFTIVSPGIEYRNEGAGFHDGMYLYSVKLPSGERVAARINNDSVVTDGETIFDGNSTLPVGRVVKDDLRADEAFLGQIEYADPLDRKDFYVDMVGEAEIQSEESYVDTPVLMVQLLTIFLTFPIFHALGAKLGLFPYFFAPRKKRKSEWE